MSSQAEISVILRMVASQFMSEMQRSQLATASFTRDLIGWKTQLTALSGSIFAVANSVGNYGDNINKAMSKTGASAEEVQVLVYAAKQSDLEFQTIVGTLEKFNKHIAETSRGLGEAAPIFKALNIDVRDSNGNIRSTTDLFLEFSKKIIQVNDSSLRGEASMRVLGKSGAELLPLFQTLGTRGFDGLKTKLEGMNALMSGDAVSQANDYKNKIRDMEVASIGLRNELGLKLLPALLSIVQSMTDIGRGPAGTTLNIFFGGLATQIIMLTGFTKELTANLKFLWSAISSPLSTSQSFDVLKKQIDLIESDMNRRMFQLKHPTIDLDKVLSNPGNTQSGPSNTQAKQDGGIDLKVFTEADQQALKKNQTAALEVAKAWQEMREAAISNRSAVEAQRIALQGTTVDFERITQVLAGQQTADSQSEFLKRSTEVRLATLTLEAQTEQDKLAQYQLYAQKRIQILTQTRDREIQVMQGLGKAPDLIAATKTESDAKITGINQELQKHKEIADAKIKEIGLQKSAAEVAASTTQTQITLARSLAVAEQDIAKARQDSAQIQRTAQLDYENNLINGVQLLKAQQEAQERGLQLDIQEAQLRRQFAQNAGEIETAEREVTLKMTAYWNAHFNNVREMSKATTNQLLRNQAAYANAVVSIGDTQFANPQEMAKRKLAALQASMQHELATTRMTEEEKGAYITQKTTEMVQLQKEAAGDFATGWEQGAQKAANAIGSNMMIAERVMSQISNKMQSGFESAFASIEQGTFRIQDALKSMLQFAIQIMNQIAAQMATKQIMSMIGSGAGAGAGGGGGSFFSGMGAMFGFNAGGVVPQVQYFATGGPVWSNGDSVRAMLTPGEGVLNRDGMKALGQLNKGGGGMGGDGDVKINIINNTGTSLPEPQVNVTRDTVKGWVYDIAFEHRRVTGSGL